MNFKNFPIYCAILVFSLAIFHIPESPAQTGEQKFYAAQAYYFKFLNDSEKIKYRDNWLVCINKFQDAYRTNPSGSLAAASLYMAGKIYRDLYRNSGKRSDKQESIDILTRVVRRFPKSDYRKKAENILAVFSDAKSSKKLSSQNVPIKKKKLFKNIEKRAYTKNEPRLKTRNEIFKKSKARYKASLKNKKSDSMAKLIAKKNKEPAKPLPPLVNPTTIEGLRVWSNPNYTRIVVDADKGTSYTHKLLKSDFSHNRPQRLYIDFYNSILGKNIKTVIPIDDDLLIGARAGQRTYDSVRVVIDIKSFKTYKIFSLQNPFRTIIDVWGSNARTVAGAYGPGKKKIYPVPAHKYEPPKNTDPNISPHDLARQLALGVHTIVIDPGHGGHDTGAPGYFRGVKEKNIVLQIAKRLARKIRRELGCKVIMTRNSDRFLSLEERTAIANTKNADLFISIHCNASKNRRAYGIETFFLNLATDDDAILVAARENATSRKNISDLQTILNDLMQNSKINESSRLATHVQNAIYRHMKRRYSKIKNKGVKQAPFYVLLGAQMPSILIETSFISNKRECKRLLNAGYQEHLCNAIIKGIRSYIKETSPLAFFKRKPGRE